MAEAGGEGVCTIPQGSRLPGLQGPLPVAELRRSQQGRLGRSVPGSWWRAPGHLRLSMPHPLPSSRRRLPRPRYGTHDPSPLSLRSPSLLAPLLRFASKPPQNADSGQHVTNVPTLRPPTPAPQAGPVRRVRMRQMGSAAGRPFPRRSAHALRDAQGPRQEVGLPEAPPRLRSTRTRACVSSRFFFFF
jgi:hypothetical protein